MKRHLTVRLKSPSLRARIAVVPWLGILLALLLAVPWISTAHAASGSSVVPVGPRAPLAPAGNIMQPNAAQSLLQPLATKNPGTGKSTDFDWATLVLEDGGWPTSSNNVTVITQWMASENCIPTTSGCPYPWWNRNNPLNNGLGSGGGDGTGSYENLVIAAYYVALNLEASNYGYPQIAADLAASDAPSVTATAIEDSDWAESHYGYGSGWHSSAVESIAAPASAWGNGGGSPPDEGSFVSYGGNVYRIVGGAPLLITDCNTIPGGCGTPTPVSTLSEFSSTVANGTAIVELDNGTGGYWSAVGGTILPVTSCSGVDAPVCANEITVNYASVGNYDAQHPTIANSTTIFELDNGTGGYWRAVGGTIVPVSSCEGPDAPLCQNNVQEDYGTIQSYIQQHPTIANSTTIVELDNGTGGYWRAVGGTIVPVSSCEGPDAPLCQNNVQLNYDVIQSYIQQHPTIANSTTIVELDNGTGGYWRAVGGTIVPVSSCEGPDAPLCQNNVQLNYGVIQGYIKQHPTIANNTTIFELDSGTGGYWRAAGGTILPVTSCEGVDAPLCANGVQLNYGEIEAYDQQDPTIANGTVLHDVDFGGGGYFVVEEGVVDPIMSCTGLDEALCTGPSVLLNYATIENYAAEHPAPVIKSGKEATSLPSPPSSGGTPSPVISSTSAPAHGVLGTKTGRPSNGTRSLSRTLAKCRKIKNRRKRAKCEAAAKRRYGARSRRRTHQRGSR